MAAKDASDTELTALLCRGLSRLAVAAEGSDAQLDTLLTELRHLLRGDLRDRARFAQVVDAIEQRIKAIDQLSHGAALALQQALERLLAPLLASPAAGSLQGELIILRRALADLCSASLPGFLNRLADAQQQLLEREAPRAPFWTRLFGREESTSSAEGTTGPAEVVVADAPPESRSVASLGDDIGQVVQHLFEQIEIPAAAADNHRQVMAQLESGLTWEAIIPALQEVSIIMLTVIEHDR